MFLALAVEHVDDALFLFQSQHGFLIFAILDFFTQIRRIDDQN
jgi:hypothetical protein